MHQMAEDVRVPDQAFGGDRVPAAAVLGGMAFPPRQYLDRVMSLVAQRRASRVGAGAGLTKSRYISWVGWNAP
jgi:hypothetical protein